MKRILVPVLFAAALVMGTARSRAASESKSTEPAGKATEAAKSGDEITVTGEVLDLACYLDHGAKGSAHKECAETCIKSGLPVGIKGEDGHLYLLIGDHKPINDQIAAHAAGTVTVKGKLAQRDGLRAIENARIVM